MTIYVTHTCKNKKCGAGFVDIDTTNAQDYPPTNKYCPTCKENGMVNIKDKRGLNGALNLQKYREQKALQNLDAGEPAIINTVEECLEQCSSSSHSRVIQHSVFTQLTGSHDNHERWTSPPSQ